MAKDHGLAGLFSDKGNRPKQDEDTVVGLDSYADADERPPVLDDADASPLQRLRQATDKAYGDDSGEDERSSYTDGYGQEADYDEDNESEDQQPTANTGGILCFLLDDPIGGRRMRTIAALNVAAGMGSVRLRTLPGDPEEMDRTLFDTLQSTDCELVAFLSPGTEPADDWALECQIAFTEAPRMSAMNVKPGNADPLNPWARTAFLLDMAERHLGKVRGTDTMVFRRDALEDLGPSLGDALRSGELVHAIQERGHEIGNAIEARIVLAEPEDRDDVLNHIRENSRASAQRSAAKKNFLVRIIYAAFILLGYPFRLRAIGKAAKKATGRELMQDLFPKAMAAVWTDRKVRAGTMLRPGKKRRKAKA